MTSKPPLISTRDYMLLQGLRPPLGDEVLSAMLRHKLAAAVVLFPADIGLEVIRLGSMVRYRAGRQTFEMTLVADPVPGDGQLPLLSRHGLALLGASVGDEVPAPRVDGFSEMLAVDEVGTAGASRGHAAAFAAGTMLHDVSDRIVPFARRAPSLVTVPANAPDGDDDDPGPSAA